MNIDEKEKLEKIKFQLLSELDKHTYSNESHRFIKNDVIDLIEQVKTGRYKAIQNARRWQEEYIITKELMGYFFKYLVAFSTTLTTFSQRLYILYLINDILSHSSKNNNIDVSLEIKPSLLALLRLGYYAPDAEKDKIEDLLNLWSEKKYFTEITMKAIRAGLMVPLVQTSSKPNFSNTSKNHDYIKPFQHGRQGASYWELPAACMIPLLPDAKVIKESIQSYISIPPHLCQPITLSNHTSPKLLEALNTFYKEESMNLWSFKENSDTEDEDIDYEGWSKKFWEKRKEKEKTSIHCEQEYETNRSDLSSSRSSRSKERSGSNSSSSYLSPSRSKTLSRSHSRSPSPSPSPPSQKNTNLSNFQDIQKEDYEEKQYDGKIYPVSTEISNVPSQLSSTAPLSENSQTADNSKSQRTKEIAIKRGWKVR
ncbi:hypothetical protein T552_01023 [Pneumocystis carinii B80]|uniref:CID domain-containing protein n=1 Tax=Pneumocystis carinii (strain B80) TaxID=1408658 RepID=A0A0W4ZN58_PNEC8|nr:hypothetical protein T552_01023 [Pneumocystis carinii B80]KTW29818.1 hypothetical protein T552_01023 [Pneumocystis carinii B80]